MAKFKQPGEDTPMMTTKSIMDAKDSLTYVSQPSADIVDGIDLS